MSMKRVTLLSSIALSLMSFATLPVQAAEKPKPVLESRKETPSEKINLNTADVKTLTHSLKGIGKKRAEAIIAYRESHKGFRTIEDLAKVKGFSKNFLTANAEKIKETFSVD